MNIVHVWAGTMYRKLHKLEAISLLDYNAYFRGTGHATITFVVAVRFDALP